MHIRSRFCFLFVIHLIHYLNLRFYGDYFLPSCIILLFDNISLTDVKWPFYSARNPLECLRNSGKDGSCFKADDFICI